MRRHALLLALLCACGNSALCLLAACSGGRLDESASGSDYATSVTTATSTTTTTTTTTTAGESTGTASSTVTTGESTGTTVAPTSGGTEPPGGTCGDGVIDDGEDCDGAELGGQTCESLDIGFSGGTLACSTECAFDVSGCESGPAVVLNELEAVDDGIELYNAGGAPVDLSGWILTDDVVDQNYDPAADPEKLVFPPQTSLPATGFLVVPKGMGPGQHPFGLAGDGDTVTLLRPNLEVVDQVSYAASEADVSYCRLPDGPTGVWTAGCAPTIGQPNQAG